MNKFIKAAMERGRLVLLLGAGASCTSKNSRHEDLPTGTELIKIISEEIGLDIDDNDSLADVYSSAQSIIGQASLIKLLEKEFKHCIPSYEYKELVKYPFPRIYTFNIDDALERAANNNENKIKFNTKRRNSNIDDVDQLHSKIDYIKLNGDICNPEEGFIFSAAEYGEGSLDEPAWYKELSRDFNRFTFLFIGTTLKEPLFYHQLQKYKKLTNEQRIKSYLLVPNLSTAQKTSFAGSNIEHVNGSLSDFINWLKLEFPNYLQPNDILKLTNSLNSSAILYYEERHDDDRSILNDVLVVNRATLNLATKDVSYSKVRDFYKGFKPSWKDILDSVPAELDKTKEIFNKIIEDKHKIFVIKGPAGSGKTTALKQITLTLSESTVHSVYYIEEFKINVDKLVSYLDKKNKKKYYLCIERIAENASDVSKIIENNLSEFVVFICAENQRIWNQRGLEYFQNCTLYVQDYSQIRDVDVDVLLDKIKQYGNWTRLSKMSLKNRRFEILNKAKRQILFGLIEATSGEGFTEIIQREYSKITEYSERILLLLVSLATTQRVQASEATITKALKELNCFKNVNEICENLSGVITDNNGEFFARHRVFADNILNYVDINELQKIIISYITAFSDYTKPIAKYILSNKEAVIYKGLVNFKFLNKHLKNDKELILQIYLKFEKKFELDGLFLLQYGLALRSFNQHDDALSKLRIARDAYPESPHIEHAFAQQLLIIAEKRALMNEPDKEFVLDYLNQAINILKSVSESINNKSDKYPLLTLSFGHIKIIRILGDVAKSKELARNYYNEISSKFYYQKKSNTNIKNTLNNLMRYSNSGESKYLKYLADNYI